MKGRGGGGELARLLRIDEKGEREVLKHSSTYTFTAVYSVDSVDLSG